MSSDWGAVDDNIEIDLLRFAESTRKQQPKVDPCSIGSHLLNPRALEHAGTYVCARGCGMLVDVPEGGLNEARESNRLRIENALLRDVLTQLVQFRDGQRDDHFYLPLVWARARALVERSQVQRGRQ